MRYRYSRHSLCREERWSLAASWAEYGLLRPTGCLSTWTTRLSMGGGPADSSNRIRSGRAPRAISFCMLPAMTAVNRERIELITFAVRL